MAEEKILALADYRTNKVFSASEKLVLEYASQMTRTPVDVAEELFDELRAAFNPGQLVELTTAIAWENYRARFNHAFGCESENFSAGAACALPVRAESGTA